ncbi:MAG TPA: RING finger protein [Planctomycetota bacterium]|nr:RING finger protein [Planctomycetota bacterium]
MLNGPMNMTVAVLAAARGEGAPFVAFFVIVILLVFLSVVLIKSKQRRANLEAAARRFRGTFIRSFMAGDRVEFSVDGAPAELTYHPGSKSRSPCTRLRTRQRPSGTLRIVPEGLFASLRKIFGAQDIEVGDGRFDADFLIQGSPEPWVRDFLDAEARRRISVLASLGASFFAGTGVNLEAGPGGVTISCGRNLVDDRGTLDSFLEHTLELLRRIQARPQTAGVQFLSAEEHAQRGECPVCSSPLLGETRRCAACATPHHVDCWNYFGGCAIYACGRRGGRRS